MRPEGPRGGAELSAVWLNGAPGIRIDIDGEITVATSLTVADRRITRLYAVGNPHKLGRLREEVRFSRVN